MAKERGEEELVQEAVAEGIELILHDRPRFRDREQVIASHIKQKYLRHGISVVEGEILKLEEKRGGPFSAKERAEKFYTGLANYVAGGGAFDQEGKNLILRESLEERARRSPRSLDAQILKGEKRLEQAGEAFRRMYDHFKSGDYAQHMPEVAQAVTTVYKLGFLSSALDLMKQYGLIDDARYALIKKSIHDKAGRGIKETEEGIARHGGIDEQETKSKKDLRYQGNREEVKKEKGYAHQTSMREYEGNKGKSNVVKNVDFKQSDQYQEHEYQSHRVAAVVLGIAGLLVMVFSATRFSGGVIGASLGEKMIPFAGIFLCVAAWLLLVYSRKASSSRNV